MPPHSLLNNLTEFTLRYRSRIVINALKPYINSGESVLDIGCGNGVVGREIESFFGCKVTGTDILYYMKKDIFFKIMPNSETLDFKDNEFDTALLIDVLHHVPYDSQVKLVREAVRVCRKVLIFEVRPSFLAKAVDFSINLFHNLKMPKPMTHRAENEWARLFAEGRINCECFSVSKPVFLYPSHNFLLYVKQNSQRE